MNIALIGYGKMGKEIEQIALERGHRIVLKVDRTNAATYTVADLSAADVAIEFSKPEAAVHNIHRCFEANVPIVVGTTGWLNDLSAITDECERKGQALFYASNYSIGVNLFFKLNTYLAKLMKRYPQYNVSMEEIHHVHKLDAPSGTAISLANQVIAELDHLKHWVNKASGTEQELPILSKRLDEVPGTHTVSYRSTVDEINITHIAHNRKGFALGAVLAAEWIKGRTGVFGMNELLSEIN